MTLEKLFFYSFSAIAFLACSDDPAEVTTPEIDEPDELIWSDEFDGTALDESVWLFDIGTGSNGWGNQELQYYTKNPGNISVSNGTLKITAKRQQFAASQFTSARIKTETKFNFTYGKIEARAKLPTGVGTWPAIWMLGSNITSVGWPACGEIDIMEHVGKEQDRIYGSLHYPGRFAGNANSGEVDIAGVSDEFHTYSVVWNEAQISFAVDGNVFHTASNGTALPFNNDFFLLVNVAMGGNFGGPVSGGFNESTLEVDYIRVYQ